MSMSTLAMTFGGLLAGLGGYLYAETRQPTGLIPAYFGAALILCGLVARVERLRMHAMHVAALLGLAGLVMPLVMVVKKLLGGGEFTTGTWGQLGMAALSGIFLGLCVKSFIDARRARKAREAEGAK